MRQTRCISLWKSKILDSDCFCCENFLEMSCTHWYPVVRNLSKQILIVVFFSLEFRPKERNNPSLSTYKSLGTRRIFPVSGLGLMTLRVAYRWRYLLAAGAGGIPPGKKRRWGLCNWSPGKCLFSSPGKCLFSSPGKCLFSSPGKCLFSSPGKCLFSSWSMSLFSSTSKNLSLSSP